MSDEDAVTPVRELIADVIGSPAFPTSSVKVMEKGTTPSPTASELTRAYAASTIVAEKLVRYASTASVRSRGAVASTHRTTGSPAMLPPKVEIASLGWKMMAT